MAKISTVTSLQSSVGEKANIASPTFTGLPTAPSYAVTVGGTRTFGYSVSVDHQAGNAGSVGLIITDGGNASGVFVENTHNGTYSSQEVVIRTAKGGVSLATEILRITALGVVSLRLASIPNAGSDALAAAAGIPVGGIYRTGSALMIRTV